MVKSVGISPVLSAILVDSACSVDDTFSLIDKAEDAKRNARGRYKKKAF